MTKWKASLVARWIFTAVPAREKMICRIAATLPRRLLPRIGSGGPGRWPVIVFGQEVQHLLAVLVEFRVIEQRLAIARSRQIDVQYLADGGVGAVGHHDDSVGQ